MQADMKALFNKKLNVITQSDLPSILYYISHKIKLKLELDFLWTAEQHQMKFDMNWLRTLWDTELKNFPFFAPMWPGMKVKVIQIGIKRQHLVVTTITATLKEINS